MYQISLITREINIKTTMRYHVTHVRMAIIKSQEITRAGKDRRGTLVYG